MKSFSFLFTASLLLSSSSLMAMDGDPSHHGYDRAGVHYTPARQGTYSEGYDKAGMHYNPQVNSQFDYSQVYWPSNVAPTNSVSQSGIVLPTLLQHSSVLQSHGSHLPGAVYLPYPDYGKPRQQTNQSKAMATPPQGNYVPQPGTIPAQPLPQHTWAEVVQAWNSNNPYPVAAKTEEQIRAENLRALGLTEQEYREFRTVMPSVVLNRANRAPYERSSAFLLQTMHTYSHLYLSETEAQQFNVKSSEAGYAIKNFLGGWRENAVDSEVSYPNHCAFIGERVFLLENDLHELITRRSTPAYKK